MKPRNVIVNILALISEFSVSNLGIDFLRICLVRTNSSTYWILSSFLMF